MAIENGLYSVDADSVAESMVERFLERYLGNSAGYAERKPDPFKGQ